MAPRHQGKTEEQALIENIELNRRVISDICAKIPNPGKIAGQWRSHLDAKPLKMTSMAVLAGIVIAGLLGSPFKKRTKTREKRPIMPLLLDWLIQNADKPQKDQSGSSAPFTRHLFNTIRQILK